MSPDSARHLENQTARQQRFLSLFLRSEREIFRYVLIRLCKVAIEMRKYKIDPNTNRNENKTIDPRLCRVIEPPLRGRGPRAGQCVGLDGRRIAAGTTWLVAVRNSVFQSADHANISVTPKRTSLAEGAQSMWRQEGEGAHYIDGASEPYTGSAGHVDG
jgi:hypothetical protein